MYNWNRIQLIKGLGKGASSGWLVEHNHLIGPKPLLLENAME